MVRKARTRKLGNLRSLDRSSERALEKVLERTRKTPRKLFTKGPAWWYVKSQGCCILVSFVPLDANVYRSSGGHAYTARGDRYSVSTKFLIKTTGYPTDDQWKEIKEEYFQAWQAQRKASEETE